MRVARKWRIRSAPKRVETSLDAADTSVRATSIKNRLTLEPVPPLILSVGGGKGCPAAILAVRRISPADRRQYGHLATLRAQESTAEAGAHQRRIPAIPAGGRGPRANGTPCHRHGIHAGRTV